MSKDKKERELPERSPEELVKHAFREFIRINRPDLEDEDSEINKKISELEQAIKDARSILAKLKGELAVSNGARAEVIREEIRDLEIFVSEYKAKKEALEESKAELLSGFQAFEAIKDDAVSLVRLEELRRESQRIRGKISHLTDQTEKEIEDIRQRVCDGLTKINRAMQKLGMATLPGLEDGGNLQLLEVGAEEVGESAVKREDEIRRLRIVAD